MKEIIPKKIKDFLATQEGQKFFKEINGDIERRRLYERKQAFLKPKKHVLRWLETMEKLEENCNNL